MGFGRRPLALAAVLTTASLAAQDPEPEKLDSEALRGRDRTAILDVRSVVMAGRAYAAANGALFGTLSCYTQPETCLPDFPKDAAPFLDPSHDWLATSLGYVHKFHPGPLASEEEILKAKAAPGSLKSFAFTVAPVKPGQTGLRAFCGDSSGRICVSRDGSEPRVKDGRCAQACPELK
ncbi:MAG TPA: hypothetical protein VN461_01305 [Vicinamibacteria bacterium]|jgi:hypothetical protein|nr:hypothetical protein [Vicinamibacteria bacterium]